MLAVFVLCGGSAAAETVPDDATLERLGARVGAVEIRVGEIFDTSVPQENRPLFRLANRLHRRTRERVIRRLLLFRPGDSYSRRVLEESERLLRTMGYLYDARIRPVRYAGGFVDILVETRDVWTLRLGAGVERRGGRNEFRVGLEDANLLGWGKRLEFEQRQRVDRSERLVRYSDADLQGHRIRLALVYADNSDGRARAFELQRPFYALAARHAWGVEHRSDDRVDTHYAGGEVLQRFRHRELRSEWFAGFSRGLQQGWTRRWRAGFAFERHRFSSRPGETSVLPVPRTLAYPWIEFEAIEDKFAQLHDVDTLVRTEDLHLGWRWRLRLGRALPAFGADRARWIFAAAASHGAQIGERGLWRAGLDLAGRRGEGRMEHLRLGLRARYDWRDWGPHRLVVALLVEAAQRLDEDVQLLLGGDNGLRGYPLRFQDGDRSVRLSVEQRFYGPWHLWRLFYMGGAVFVDAGRAWFDGHSAARPWLADAGAGLRFASSRAPQGSVLHVDVALPLRRFEAVQGVQVLVTAKESF